MELREWLMVRISKLEKLRESAKAQLEIERSKLHEISLQYEESKNNLDLIESEMNEILREINAQG